MPNNPERRRTKPKTDLTAPERGRPPVHEKINLKVLEELSAIGMGVKSIAEYMGVSKPTLDRYISEKPEVNAVYRRGASKGQKKALGSLARAMEKGNVMAIIFYLVNKFPEEWQSVNRGFQITNNNNNTNGQFGQIIAKDKKAGEMATDLVKRLSNKIPDANGE
jgi:hypothetical protein